MCIRDSASWELQSQASTALKNLQRLLSTHEQMTKPGFSWKKAAVAVATQPQKNKKSGKRASAEARGGAATVQETESEEPADKKQRPDAARLDADEEAGAAADPPDLNDNTCRPHRNKSDSWHAQIRKPNSWNSKDWKAADQKKGDWPRQGGQSLDS